MIIEGDANYCVSGYAYYLLPDVMEHEITQPLIDGRYYAMTPMAQPLEAMEEVTDATVTTLLQTSASSYAKAEGYDMQTTEQEEDDAVGAVQRGDGLAARRREARLGLLRDAAGRYGQQHGGRGQP